ncbi:putative leucine-rich repeat-containing protein DDB_G0290503 [Centruroides vittatus]|uniref:putative leucine-rich repeat-containing protein DDB_G0290503 n=1 Tax=Centruroides vittatus TaxID=120091 RepID=UPI0035106A02
MAFHKSCYQDIHKDISLSTACLGELSTRENDSVLSNSIIDKLKQKDKEIDNLKKCKEELSNTVISLKQEIYSLKEERLKMENYNKEIKSKLLMISERNAALVQEKTNLNLENQKLKMEMLSMSEARYNIQSPIGASNIPFHTYPWLFQSEKSIAPFSSTPLRSEILSVCKSKKNISDSKENVSESWEEISQKLFAQMKTEMKDLEELGKRLSLESLGSEICESCGEIENKALSENELLDKTILAENEAEKIILEQQKQLRNIKKCALEQNRTVRKLLQKILDFTKSSNSPIPYMSQRNIAKIYDVNDKFDSETISNIERKFQFTRPSDESFRAYFTQQLYNTGQLLQNSQSKLSFNEKLKTSSINPMGIITDAIRTEQKILNTSKSKEDNLSVENTIPMQTYMQDKLLTENNSKTHPVLSEDRETNVLNDDDRICPMCQAVFPKTVSQQDFEMHVVSHFEIENNSILDNFEVI